MDFIAKKNTIAAATSNAAPANKLTSELERPYHINNAIPKNAIEIHSDALNIAAGNLDKSRPPFMLGSNDPGHRENDHENPLQFTESRLPRLL
jgi:hypothetical protein